MAILFKVADSGLTAPWSDDFDTIDTDFWTLNAGAQTHFYTEDSQIKFDVDETSDTYCAAQFNYLLSGDFIIQSTCGFTGGTEDTASSLHYVAIGVYEDGGSNFVYTGTTRSNVWTERVVANNVVENMWISGNLNGVFRLTRTGSTLKAYEYNGVSEQWEWNGNTNGLTVSEFTSSLDMQPRIWIKQESNARMVGQFHNFEIVTADKLIYSPV